MVAGLVNDAVISRGLDGILRAGVETGEAFPAPLGVEGNFRLQINGGISPESGNPFTEVIDNGPGIPPETVRQIFEPFFTTENAGTGLGLYIARELSESNRLRLEYVPIPTGGSCFKLTFPTTKANILPL